MKKILISGLFLITLLSASQAQYRTERTGYEGDYFSLEGAIEIFKQAHSIRDFERKINSKNTYVNNLDLNYDGRIDYVRVEHRRQGDFHAIIMQVPIDKYDLQDVAVIEIEKIGRRDAVLQIIGDEDLYGEEVIVEPFLENGYASNSGRSSANYVSTDYVNVYYWPAVQSIFDDHYTVYVSPYRWSYYPTWWSTWRPFSWSVYHPRIRNYHRHCHVVKIYRAPHVHRFYRSNRSHSHHVAQRTSKIRSQHAKSHGSKISKNQPSRRSDAYGSVNRNKPHYNESNRQQRMPSRSDRSASKPNYPKNKIVPQKPGSTSPQRYEKIERTSPGYRSERNPSESRTSSRSESYKDGANKSIKRTPAPHAQRQKVPNNNRQEDRFNSPRPSQKPSPKAQQQELRSHKSKSNISSKKPYTVNKKEAEKTRARKR